MYAQHDDVETMWHGMAWKRFLLLHFFCDYQIIIEYDCVQQILMMMMTTTTRGEYMAIDRYGWDRHHIIFIATLDLLLLLLLLLFFQFLSILFTRCRLHVKHNFIPSGVCTHHLRTLYISIIICSPSLASSHCRSMFVRTSI